MKTTGKGEKERSEEARRGRAHTDAERAQTMMPSGGSPWNAPRSHAERRASEGCDKEEAIACCRRRDGETTNRRREAMGERATKQDSRPGGQRRTGDVCLRVCMRDDDRVYHSRATTKGIRRGKSKRPADGTRILTKRYIREKKKRDREEHRRTMISTLGG